MDTLRRKVDSVLTLLPRLIAAAALFALARRLGSGLGYFARYWTAEAAGDLLGRLGVAAISSQEVLLLENGIAQVDLPCSGLKSLWTGLIFVVAAAALRGRAFGGGLLVVATVVETAILLGNVARVTLLVLLAQVAERPSLAAAAHVPLGLLFFATACAIGWLLLGLLPPASSRPIRFWLEWPLAAAAVAALIWAGGRELSAQTPPLPAPPRVETGQALPLTPVESGFFATQPARVGKWRLTLPADGPGAAPRSLDLLLVAAGSWQAHHAPELCLAAAGFKVDSFETREPAGLFELRHLRLDGGRRQAIYFFQSRQLVTAHLMRRMFGATWLDDDAWVLATVVFDGDLPLEDPRLHHFLLDLHQAIAKTLAAADPLPGSL